MTIKITPQLTETKEKIEEESFLTYLLNYKMSALNKGILIPDLLISEIEKFNKSNYIALTESPLNKERYIYHSCPRCLKAHTLKKAQEIGLDEAAINYVSQLFDCEKGHHGYYLDNEELKEI